MNPLSLVALAWLHFSEIPGRIHWCCQDYHTSIRMANRKSESQQKGLGAFTDIVTIFSKERETCSDLCDHLSPPLSSVHKRLYLPNPHPIYSHP